MERKDMKLDLNIETVLNPIRNRNIITFILISWICWILYKFYFLITHPIDIGSLVVFSEIIVPIVLLILSKRIISNLLERKYSKRMNNISFILIGLSIIWISQQFLTSFFIYPNAFYFSFYDFEDVLISILSLTNFFFVLLPTSLLFLLIFKRRSQITSVLMLVCSVILVFFYLTFLILISFFWRTSLNGIIYIIQIIIPISFLLLSLFFIKRKNKKLGSTFNQSICQNCGAFTPALSKFCTKCGTEREDNKNQSSEELFEKCSKCGNVMKEGQKFCTKCGTNLNINK